MNAKTFCTLLIFAFISSSINAKSRNRKEKFLGVFQVVSFPNDECEGNSMNGTCYLASECDTRGGSSIGSCADGFGVCCGFAISCGMTSSENVTYFNSSGLTGASTENCRITICPAHDNICQLRLDFNQFVLSGPSTNSVSVTKILNGNELPSLANGVGASFASNCLTDRFTVTNPSGVAPPAICGTNSNMHMYVGSSSACNDLAVSIISSQGVGTDKVNPIWRIRVTQYSCDFDNLAPDGCTQYFFGPSAGTVESFNFREGQGQHLANQNQNICVRRESGFCSICWFAAMAADFQVSGPTSPASATFKISSCCGYGSNGQATKGFDCVVIPGAMKMPPSTAVPLTSRFCGRGIGLRTNMATPTAATVCSSAFNIRFLSDTFEFATGTMSEAKNSVSGFKLSYMQIADTCTTAASTTGRK